jgi:hypothetical protein
MNSILNQDFDFERDAPSEVALAFDSNPVSRVLLSEGTRLWKWTDHAPDAGKSVSPWWLPMRTDESVGRCRWPVLTDIERVVKARSGGIRQVFRSGVSVLPEWNDMTRMIIIALRVPAFGFAGPAAMQQLRNDDGIPIPVYLAGGFGQLYIPHLSFVDIEIPCIRTELAREGLDPDLWGNPVSYAGPITLSPRTKRLLKMLSLPTGDRSE